MGFTRFSGPVYGAKGVLFSGHRAVVSSGSSITIFSATVPVYEDWVVTEIVAGASTVTTTSATPSRVSVLDDSTNVVNVTISDTVNSAIGIATPDGGENEGAVVAAGSSFVVDVLSASTGAAMGNLNWSVIGYRRFHSSTQYEG